MLISIRHTTRYTYEAPARYAVQSLRLTPPSFASQRILDWAIEAPGLATAQRFTDGYGNATMIVSTRETHTSLEIVARGLVETSDSAGVVRGLKDPAPARVYLRETPSTRGDPAIRELADGVKGETQLARLHALMDAIREKIDYVSGATTPHTTAAEALEQGAGVCQDHAHVFIAAARSQKIPARYVNGYFVSGAEGAESAHHAWAEVLVDNLGWVGFDVANLVCPDERFVRLAWGLDAASAAPIRGSRPMPFGAADVKEHLDVRVEVQQQQQNSQQ